MPSRTLPKTTCFPSNQEVVTVVMNYCDMHEVSFDGGCSQFFTYKLRTWLSRGVGDVSHGLSSYFQSTHHWCPFLWGPSATVNGHHHEMANSPALAIDRRPGPVCLSLLKSNEHGGRCDPELTLTSSRRGNDRHRWTFHQYHHHELRGH